jgi:hypothetical protein
MITLITWILQVCISIKRHVIKNINKEHYLYTVLSINSILLPVLEDPENNVSQTKISFSIKNKKFDRKYQFFDQNLKIAIETHNFDQKNFLIKTFNSKVLVKYDWCCQTKIIFRSHLRHSIETITFSIKTLKLLSKLLISIKCFFLIKTFNSKVLVKTKMWQKRSTVFFFIKSTDSFDRNSGNCRTIVLIIITETAGG